MATFETFGIAQAMETGDTVPENVNGDVELAEETAIGVVWALLNAIVCRSNLNMTFFCRMPCLRLLLQQSIATQPA